MLDGILVVVRGIESIVGKVKDVVGFISRHRRRMLLEKSDEPPPLDGHLERELWEMLLLAERHIHAAYKEGMQRHMREMHPQVSPQLLMKIENLNVKFTQVRPGMHWKGGSPPSPLPRRPAHAQPLFPERQVPPSMAFVIDSSRPQLLC